MPKQTYSASQQLRFRILKLWETKGSKLSQEEFYQKKMDLILKEIDQEIFDFENGYERIGSVSMLPQIDAPNLTHIEVKIKQVPNS